MIVRHGASGPGVVHLDTNFLIRALDVGSEEEILLATWLDVLRPLMVSSAAWAEFLCGPVSPAAVQVASEVVGRPLPFGATEAVIAADCFNASGRRRGTMVDCMIAATAMAAGAALATANVDDFRRLVPLGLRLAT